MKGKIRYIPKNFDDFLVKIQEEEALPSLGNAMEKAHKYAIIGKEMELIYKNPFRILRGKK